MSIDDVMARIRAGDIQVFLVDGQLGWAAKCRDEDLLAALAREAEPIKKMVATSDTRICMRVSAHCPHYRKAEPWFSCPDCRRTREHWITIALERQQEAHRVAS